jgi:hypothetical protein
MLYRKTIGTIAEGLLMPAKQGQKPPDLKYFGPR